MGEYLWLGLSHCTTGARGDWVPVPGGLATPTDEVAAFFHTLCVGYMAEIAQALGRQHDSDMYTARFAANKLAYHKKFFNQNTTNTDSSRCCYGLGSQTSNIFALHLGLVPEEYVNLTVSSLVASIQTRSAELTDPSWGPGPQ